MAADNISYSLAEPSQFAEILQFLLDNFLYDHPAHESVGLSREDATPFFSEIARHCVDEDPQLSFVARDGEDLVGVRLCTKWNADMKDNEKEEEAKFAPSVQSIIAYSSIIDHAWHKLVPTHVHNVMHYEIVSVRKSHARRGIAQKLNLVSIDRACELGFDGIYAHGTALASQRMYEKMGFDVLKIFHNKYFLDKNGKQIIKCTDDTTSGVLYFKMLKEQKDSNNKTRI